MKTVTILIQYALLALPTILGKGGAAFYYEVDDGEVCEKDSGNYCLSHDNKTLIDDDCEGKTCYSAILYQIDMESTEPKDLSVNWGDADLSVRQ